MAEIELTLNSPLTEEQWDTITDVDFDHTNRIWFNTKHGKQVEFVKVKPVTSNADSIRAMTDEELAEIIMCPREEKCPSVYANCLVCSTKWLKSQAEGGDDHADAAD